MSNNEKIKKMLGSRIFLLRNLDNLTQKKLAEEIGVSRSTIQNYELAINMPSIDFLIKISDFYDIPIEAFFGSDEYFDHILAIKQRGWT